LDAGERDRVERSFQRRFEGLARIGRDEATGGLHRLAWTPADVAARAWFECEAAALGLVVETDRFGNLWAWWGEHSDQVAVATGSHLDSVRGGGQYDGALGVVAALGAVEVLMARDVEPARPIVVAVFVDEEGGRFGRATLGSRLAAGITDWGSALDVADADGLTLRAAMVAAGKNPNAGRPDVIDRVGVFIELHIEQGRRLAEVACPIGIGIDAIPHGRWEMVAGGQSNHAGSTPMADRRDPVIVLAEAVLEAERLALHHGAVATIGRVELEPNTTNAIAATARAWLDARAADETTLTDVVAAWTARLVHLARFRGIDLQVEQVSRSPGVAFDPALGRRVIHALEGSGMAVHPLSTAAGHDASTLAQVIPTAMLFVRNPTGVSHAPAEAADAGDVASGIEALAIVLADLALSTDTLPGRAVAGTTRSTSH
jgi:N-carbamoyl-L-amino-acid hydrolase